MSTPLSCAVSFLTAYLIGSLPFGFLIARYAAGVDIRKSGSGNIGATNVARVLGKKLGVTVLVLDCLKGALPTAILPLLMSEPGPLRLHLAVLSGTAAILGHMFPVWLKFRGGKGVATALGVALTLAFPSTPISTAVAIAVFVLCAALTRFASLSSILGAWTFCGIELWQLRPAPFGDETWSLALFSTLVPLLIVIRHRSNLVRLMRGTEPKFEFGGKSERAAVPAVGEKQSP